jgi:hypothetical protein
MAQMAISLQPHDILSHGLSLYGWYTSVAQPPGLSFQVIAFRS